MQFLKKIIALICVIAISLSCLVVPAFAFSEIGDFASGIADFGSWAIDTSLYGIKLVARIFDKDVCPERPGGVNTTHSFVVNTTTKDGVLADWYVCEYCGFNSGYKADSDGFSAAYDDYVATLPATGYNSAGKILWQPTFSDFDPDSKIGAYNFSSFPVSTSLVAFSVLPSGNGFCCVISSKGVRLPFSFSNCRFVPPVLGSYQPVESVWYSSSSTGDVLYSPSSFTVSSSEDESISFSCLLPSSNSSVPDTFYIYFPVFEVTPASALSGDTYNTTTRPTSITGGNYGIIGDNGQITQVTDNSSIVNETNNTYYNPATGLTVPITGWSYDYSDRSYSLDLQGGNTSTVTYGDENISITETSIDASTGDTITNNYTIYYLINGTGSSGQAHDWRETGLTPASCLAPGVKEYTCADCGETKIESTPALGHNWRILRTVTTQYDDDGVLVQEGYILYECERCGEQYRTTDTSVKPSPGSPGNTGTGSGNTGIGSGTSSGEEKETIWQKIGKLLGTIGDGVLGMLEALLSKILDGLISLAEMLVAKLKTVVEAILRIFDVLPTLFGGFLDFLVAMFPFLPPELMTILTFGVIAVVFIGIIKAVRR